MKTTDIIKGLNPLILDAQERDDGYVEAVHLTGSDNEELLLYEVNNGTPVLMEVVDPDSSKPEMYRWDKRLRTWFHSRKTQSKLKKKEKEEKEEIEV